MRFVCALLWDHPQDRHLQRAQARSSPRHPGPGSTPPSITNMAICPVGAGSLTGKHDLDYFAVTVDVPSTVVARLTYQIAYGDLDTTWT